MKKTRTWKDITEIPALLEAFSAGEAKSLKEKALKSSDGFVYLIGRGSSGNATLYAKYIWEIYAGVQVGFIHPHAVFEARREMDFRGKAVWAFSQSGQSPDVVECLKKLAGWGAETVAVTNEPDLRKNPLAEAAMRHILLSDSRETTVAATKTFALELWLSLWTAHVWSGCFKPEDFKKTAALAEECVSRSASEDFDFWPELKKAGNVAFVGRGPLNAVAEDAALKFREMAGVHAEAHSAAEFLHGPIGAHGPNDLALLLSPEKKLPADLEKVKKALSERKSPWRAVSYAGVKPPFNSLLVDILLKIAALRLAVEKGLNPDTPQGLSKVTETF